ncbi:MAG: hypothetical protein [Circular genetic element sp.]|nr:MAG: hypothetical protein [Circular genetic element sp.]
MNKSFGFTIRPKCGIEKNSVLELKILKAIEKFDYFHCVAEKDGVDRHLHFQIWSDEEKRKGDIKKTFTRICERQDWWDQGHKKFCIKDKFCYNDWYDNYLDEDNPDKINDQFDLLLDNVPAHSDEYYPSDASQEKWKAKANAVDKTFYHLKELWDNWSDDPPEDLIEVVVFYNDMMFKSKKIKIIEDKKKRCQRCECLFYYLKGGAPKSFCLMGQELTNYENSLD